MHNRYFLCFLFYIGYVLAEMSVHQTRAHFLKTYGRIVDEPNVGKDLTEVYWKPGNSESYMTLVQVQYLFY